MKSIPTFSLVVIAAILVSSEGMSQTTPDDGIASLKRAVPAPKKPIPLTQRPSSTVTAQAFEPPDVSTSKASLNDPAAFQALSPATALASTTLSPPVTLSYSGSSSVLTINDAGTGKGIQSTITNTKSSVSALWGTTVGSGAGLSGYNGGTTGPAGKFGITNQSSDQPAVLASTVGRGPAISATTAGNASGIVASGSIGVEGHASGGTPAYGVEGYSDIGGGAGVDAEDHSTYGGAGLSAYSDKGTAIVGVGPYAAILGGDVSIQGNVQNDGTLDVEKYDTSSATTAASVHNAHGVGVYAASDDNYGLEARSTNSHAVDAVDAGTGVGIYASSFSGNAGYFYGPVVITNTLTVGSTLYSSDRNLKTDFIEVDGHALLERLSSLPIGTWQYKTDNNLRHLGPMAQDFHAAFDLNGNDDTHINEVDAIGVSLAAVQELNRQLKLQDAQIAKLKIDNAAEVADLKKQLADQAKTLADIRRQDNAIQTALIGLQRDRRVAQR